MAELAQRRLVDLVTAPRSVVVVGASADPAKPAGRPLAYLGKYGYAGDVWVVNPRHSVVAGYPAVPNVLDVPVDAAEAAIVNLPADQVPSALHDLDSRGVRVAVVIGSGFERPDSAPRQELNRFLASPDRRLRVIGPNCVGTMSVASGTHLNFSSVLGRGPVRTGAVALITQSGASGNGLLMSILRRGGGIAHWFSTGDEFDVGALELLAGLLPRDDVQTVGLFLEAITDLEWLPEVTDTIARTGKRVFVVKIADSDLGQLAAGGHTGRVVGSGDISHAVLRRAGFVRVPGIAELADCLVTAQIVGPLPPRPRLAAASVSGAGAVVLADHVQQAPALSLPAWEAPTLGRLRAVLADRVELHNPMDVPFLGETETFGRTVATLSEAPESDVVVAVESSLAHDRDVLADVLTARPAGASPVVLSHLSEDDPIPEDLVVRLAAARVAVVPTPERAVRALGLLAGSPDAVEPALRAPEDLTGYLGLPDIAALLPTDFPWAPWVSTPDRQAAAGAARRWGYPVAIKAAGRTIAHRSELGAVAVVRGEEQLADAYERVASVCAEHGDEVVVQQGAGAGREVLVAVLRDPEYGLSAVIRPGGIAAELLDDQVVLWHGWSEAQRLAVLRESRLGVLMSGYRGQPARDVAALNTTITALFTALAEQPVSFVELNPVVVLPHGVRAIDAIGRK
ncbi:acetate--CoA ligase family protein [Amycolatopsis sp. FDAARGOS 1241]|uniref:acetate--CoA ligase family protein n=1 Tax=Amycolatopsis sp. FDAARGOS 1241 TaxID=2778070 RepID=UPI00194F62E1|nr:acetate--CoA ligase family protein [Amycolatopsis sp. FDAARGOS 1241]QRP47112.1 acetate--CoA ligase family protein [Amycolatopsis sp. FDAARGOS 1241]